MSIQIFAWNPKSHMYAFPEEVMKRVLALFLHFENFRDPNLKVVILSTACKQKEKRFFDPRDEFWIFGRYIWERNLR